MHGNIPTRGVSGYGKEAEQCFLEKMEVLQYIMSLEVGMACTLESGDATWAEG